MDPLRTAGIWLGVGAGHVAVLVAAWGWAGRVEPSDGATLNVLLVASEPAPAIVAPVRAEPVDLGRSPRPPVAPVFAAAPSPVPVASSPAAQPGPLPAHATPGEPLGFIDRVEPLYPRGSRLAGIEGVVRLRLCVGADGVLSRVSVAASSGDEALDRAALAAATASTYRPARVGGRAVTSEAEASYRFELR